MKLSTKPFSTWTKTRGSHFAATFSFDNPRERDKFMEKLSKQREVGFCRKKDTRNEFWVTAHYNEGKQLVE